MRTKQLLFILALSFCAQLAFGQDVYYWSDKRKIYLIADSAQILVSPEPSNVSQVKASIKSLEPESGIAEIKLGRSESLVIKTTKQKYKTIAKNLTKNFSQSVDYLPVYKHNDIPYYFTNEIILQPKKGTNIDQIIAFANNSTVNNSIKVKAETE